MNGPLDTDARRLARDALARQAYASDRVRLSDPDLADYAWLVSTHRGLYAVSDEEVKLVCHGWFFGIRLHEQSLYLFENCAHRDRSVDLGRLLRFDLTGARIAEAHVVAKGLHPNCHQLAIIDDVIHLLDTARQTILRFRCNGEPLEPVRPFGSALPSDTSGAYHHINSIAAVDDRIAVLLHNGKALPERNSQLAWFDHDWNAIGRTELPGRMCHDIVLNDDGCLWHCASLDGDIVSSAGDRIHIADDFMTRGLAFSEDRLMVGYSTFGPRQMRDGLRGGVKIYDRGGAEIANHILGGPPADIISLRPSLA